MITVAVLLSGCSTARQLHKPEPDIRSSLLQKTPVGMSRQRVEAVLKQEGWSPGPNKNGDIWAYLGRYGLLTDYRVSALWKFDKSGHLADVSVEKRINSL